MFLLDTDTCIELARGNPTLIRKFREHRRGDIQVAILTIYELEVGVRKATLHKQKKRQAVDDLLQLFAIAPFGHAEACEAAKIRAELEIKGTPICSIDYLIAGIARFNGWTVITGKQGEFRRVKNFKVEKWHA